MQFIHGGLLRSAVMIVLALLWHVGVAAAADGQVGEAATADRCQIVPLTIAEKQVQVVVDETSHATVEFVDKFFEIRGQCAMSLEFNVHPQDMEDHFEIRKIKLKGQKSGQISFEIVTEGLYESFDVQVKINENSTEVSMYTAFTVTPVFKSLSEEDKFCGREENSAKCVCNESACRSDISYFCKDDRYSIGEPTLLHHLFQYPIKERRFALPDFELTSHQHSFCLPKMTLNYQKEGEEQPWLKAAPRSGPRQDLSISLDEASREISLVVSNPKTTPGFYDLVFSPNGGVDEVYIPMIVCYVDEPACKYTDDEFDGKFKPNQYEETVYLSKWPVVGGNDDHECGFVLPTCDFSAEVFNGDWLQYNEEEEWFYIDPSLKSAPGLTKDGNSQSFAYNFTATYWYPIREKEYLSILVHEEIDTITIRKPRNQWKAKWRRNKKKNKSSVYSTSSYYSSSSSSDTDSDRKGSGSLIIADRIKAVNWEYLEELYMDVSLNTTTQPMPRYKTKPQRATSKFKYELKEAPSFVTLIETGKKRPSMHFDLRDVQPGFYAIRFKVTELLSQKKDRKAIELYISCNACFKRANNALKTFQEGQAATAEPPYDFEPVQCCIDEFTEGVCPQRLCSG